MPPEPEKKEGDENLTPEQIEGMLQTAGIANDESSTENGGETKEEKPPEWKAEMEQMRSDMQTQNTNTQNMLMQMFQQMNAAQKPAPPVAAPPANATAEERTQLYSLAMRSPELFPDIIGREIDTAMEGKFAKMEQRLSEAMNRRESNNILRDQVLSRYSEDINDPQSEIIATARQFKEQIAPLLDKSIRGTPQHDHLAILAAAGMKPGVLAKRQVARDAATERTREEQLKRLSEMAGLGRTRQAGSAEPQWTDVDDQLAAAYGMDVDDKLREEIIANKKTESMGMFQGGAYGGEMKGEK